MGNVMNLLIMLWANPLARKIAIYAAIALGILYAGRLLLNKHDSRIEQETRVKVTGELLKLKAGEWKAKEAAIATGKQAVDNERLALAQDRANLTRSVDTTLAAIRKEKVGQYANASAVPDDRIWLDIRTVSGQLAANSR